MYDVIVVGARCGGASVALRLARQGLTVLMLDRGTFPSDMTASTHMIWGAGVAELKNLGLLEQVKASNCPAMRLYNLDMGEFVLSAHAPPVDGVIDCYAPRRFILDGILVEAAVNAGAELAELCSVEGLLYKNDTVVGVRYRDDNGKTRELNSRLVIGADGMNSTIARLVSAPSFDEHPKLQGDILCLF